MYKIKNIIILNNKLITKNIKLKIRKINKNFIKNIKLYIKSGGCNGLKQSFNKFLFIYNFNILINKNLNLLIDTISKIYLNGSILNYNNLINKLKIKIKNISSRCNCGISFNIK